MANANPFVQHYRQGMELYSAGHYEQALIPLKKVLVIQPDYPDVYYLIARIYDEMQRSADALSMYEKVLSLLPNDQEAHWSYGKSLIKAGEETKGVKILKKALKKNPKDPRVRNELAKYYLQEQSPKKALSLLEAGIKTMPHYAPFYASAGDVLRKLKKLAKAQEYYELSLELDPEYEPAKRGLNAVIHALEYQEEESAEKSPEEEAREELVEAAALFRNEQYNEAIMRLLELKDRPGVERDAAMLLGMAFAKKGLFKRAYDVFLSFMKEHSPDILVLYNLGLASNRMGKYEEAMGFLQEALMRDDEYEEALLEMGIACQMSGNAAEARDYYVRVLKINRDNPRPYAQLAQLAYGKGDKAKTAEFLKRALDLDPRCPDIALVKGIISAHEGKWQAAEKNLELSLEHSPDHFEALKYLGRVRMELDKQDEAIDCLRSAVALNPSDPECNRIIAELTARRA
ncbi:MAG: tetratricopeptide repeat protein [Candidatus Omnitrophota bacterium]